MNSSFLFLGIFPLIFFVIVDSFFGIKKAAIVTILVGLAELSYTLFYFGEIDRFSIYTLVTILLFSACSFFLKRGIFIKIQPVVMSFIFGFSLIYSYLMGSPLLLEFSLKYAHLMPKMNQNLIVLPHFQHLLSICTMTMGVGLFFHGVVTLVAAIYLSNWWWLLVRGVGFYLFSFASIVAGKFFS